MYHFLETIFNPVASSAGGFLLALSVFFFSTIFGRVLGISGIIGSAFDNRDKNSNADAFWRWMFLFGMMVTGLFSAAPVQSPVSSSLTLLVSGFLVGSGTAIGSGCTSGHGLCGLSRLSPRSFTAVMVFMLSAMTVQTAIRMSSETFIRETTFPISYHLSEWAKIALIAFVLFYAVVYLIGPYTLQETRLLATKVSSFVVGLAFSIGLVQSGMSNPYKVMNFLSFPTLFLPQLAQRSTFDPSLIFVMGAGVLPNLVLFPLIQRYQSKPRMADKWQFPTSTKITTSLITGSLMFGAGWGLVGLCPGPAVVLLPSLLFGYNLWVAPWWIGFLTGTLVGRRYSANSCSSVSLKQ